ncbi:sperm-associated microtubule inner protein 10-like [Osmerus eperlanus]|uniref:sperm-associated microtubule inner protein 10-like n=1 Tax=Osmerus eperlanus TaxID=29151 RepID=UPI002E0FC66F
MAGASENINVHGQSRCHAPKFSRRHPMIPKLYVMPWKQDMKNQRLLMKNAGLVEVPCVDQEESLYLEGRERLCHGQDRKELSNTSSIIPGQSGATALNASHLSRYNSSAVTSRNLFQQP